MKKKILALVLALVMALSLAACGDSNTPAGSGSGSGSGSGYLHQSLHVVRAFEYLAPVKVVEVNADSVLPDREIRVPSEIGTRPDDPRVCFRGGFHSSGETQRDGFLQYGRLIGKLFPGT